jgi:putative glutamine amidotransferase
MTRVPLIGITSDVYFNEESRPPRETFILDSTNVRTLRAFGATPVLLPPEPACVPAYLELCDGLIVSGGGYQFQVPQLFRHDGTEPAEKERRFLFEAALLRGAIERNLPVLAECGGFQVLNHVTGGELVVVLADARPEWAQHLGPAANQGVHPVRVRPGTLLARSAGVEGFTTNSLHRQGVVKTGAAALACATTDDGIVEAIEVPGQRFCLGMQWHPEFLIDEAERRIFQAFVEACAGS